MPNEQLGKIKILPYVLKLSQPFKYNILGQLIIAIIWAADLSFRPYLVKVILNRTTEISPQDAVNALLPPVSLYIFMSALVVFVFRFYDWLFTKFRPTLRAHITEYSMNHLID